MADLEVSPLIEKVTKVVVAHPDALLHKVCLVAREEPFKPLVHLTSFAVRFLNPIPASDPNQRSGLWLGLQALLCASPVKNMRWP